MAGKVGLVPKSFGAIFSQSTSLADPITQDVEGREDIDKKRRKAKLERKRSPTSLVGAAPTLKTLLGS